MMDHIDSGYMAPEYLLHGDLSVKVDVFSYGVLILELVSGQRNSSFDPNLGAENLPDWAYKMHKKKSSQKIMDPILEPTAVEQQVVLCAHIGLLCTQSDPSLRPTMHRVRLLLSKAPSSLEEPTRPAGFTGSRYRRPRKPRASSSNASSSGSKSTASFITSVGTAISEASTRDAATSLPSPFPEYRCAVSHERSLDNQEAEVEAHDVQAVEKKVQRSKAGSSSQEALEDLPKVTDEEVFREASVVEEIKDHLSILFLLPEDYEIEKDTLIQLWMAAEHVKDEPHGEECFSVVLDEGYLFPCGTNFMTGKDRYRINTEKIDELLLGSLKDNASYYLRWRKECQNNPESIQHVSLDCSTEIDATTFQTLEKFNQLRTLLFLGKHGRRVTQMPSHLFSRFNKLQALDLSRTHMKELPSSIGHMIHLRYLDLSWTLIERLPDILCSLDQLQTIKLIGCLNLRKLPGQLYKLTKLRRLDLDVLRQLKTMPRGIGALVNLRTLSAFLVGTEDGCKIQELKELNHLSGNFCIAKLEHVDDADEAKQVALYKKEHINKLELRWTASELSSRKHNKSDPVLECLQPCTSLEELRILCYQGSKFPCWVSNPEFSKLVSITFYRCENVSELPLLEQLPLLKYLDLIKMNSITIIERRANLENDIAFFRLEKLEIDEMQSLKTWRWGSRNEDDFRSLVELTISGCPELRELDLLPHLSAIKRLEIRECPKLKSPSDTKLPDSLEELIVEDCPHIDPKEMLRADGRSFT